MTASIQVFNPATVWQVPDPYRSIYSHAVKVTGCAQQLFISGQVGIAPDGTVPTGFAEQAELAMDNVEALLARAAMGLNNLAKLSFYLIRREDAALLTEIRQRRWASAQPAAVTALFVSGLVRPELLVEIEVVAAA